MTHCCPLSPTANRLKNIKLTKSVFHFPRTFQLLHLKLEKNVCNFTILGFALNVQTNQLRIPDLLKQFPDLI